MYQNGEQRKKSMESRVLRMVVWKCSCLARSREEDVYECWLGMGRMKRMEVVWLGEYEYGGNGSRWL